MARRRRCASTQLLSFPLPRILAPSSCLCRRLALVQLFSSLHCSIDSGFGSSLRCCVGSDVAPVYTAASPMPRLNSSSSSRFLAGSLLCCLRNLATRSARHRGMTSPRLICSARLFGSSARLGSAAHLFGSLLGSSCGSASVIGPSSARLVGWARRLICSARLVGSSKIVLLHQQLHRFV